MPLFRPYCSKHWVIATFDHIMHLTAPRHPTIWLTINHPTTFRHVKTLKPSIYIPDQISPSCSNSLATNFPMLTLFPQPRLKYLSLSFCWLLSTWVWAWADVIMVEGRCGGNVYIGLALAWFKDSKWWVNGSKRSHFRRGFDYAPPPVRVFKRVDPRMRGIDRS